MLSLGQRLTFIGYEFVKVLFHRNVQVWKDFGVMIKRDADILRIPYNVYYLKQAIDIT